MKYVLISWAFVNWIYFSIFRWVMVGNGWVITIHIDFQSIWRPVHFNYHLTNRLTSTHVLEKKISLYDKKKHNKHKHRCSIFFCTVYVFPKGDVLLDIFTLLMAKRLHSTVWIHLHNPISGLFCIMQSLCCDNDRICHHFFLKIINLKFTRLAI